jgi:hypothetical protein
MINFLAENFLIDKTQTYAYKDFKRKKYCDTMPQTSQMIESSLQYSVYQNRDEMPREFIE